MKIRQKLISPSKYNIKCPYAMTPEFIVVHNTANDASAENEVQYMINNSNQVSFHFAVDDLEVVQGIPLDRNSWNAGDGANGPGNRKGISIEICYSKSGGARFDKAEVNATKLIAQLLKERNWGIDKVKKHQDFSGKYCPHRTLDLGWTRFLNMIIAEMGEKPQPSTSPKPQPNPQPKPERAPDQILEVGSIVTFCKGLRVEQYRASDDSVFNSRIGGWLPASIMTEDSASDGKLDNYFSNTKATFTINKEYTVDKVEKRNGVWDAWLRELGCWVHCNPLVELKNGK